MVSNPFRRNQIDSFIDPAMKQLLKITTSYLGEDSDVKKALIALEEDHINIGFSKNTHIYQEYFCMYDRVLENMLSRRWTVFKAEDDLTFTCCDNPVTFFSKHSEGAASICIPLSKEIALISDMEGMETNEIVLASKRMCALINLNILNAAQKYIYACREDVYFVNLDNKMQQGLKEYHQMRKSEVEV